MKSVKPFEFIQCTEKEMMFIFQESYIMLFFKKYIRESLIFLKESLRLILITV